MTTTGEMLIRSLENYGVDTVFGIPGVHTLELYRGLGNSPIRHVTPRHEQGAGFMADGYARSTGKPGVCFIITGPGMTNIATAMGQAYGDSIPMLVISSVNDVDSLGKGEGHLHEMPNQQKLIEGVAAFSASIRKADEIPTVLARAFAVFNSARPRPVHIEIPIDLLGAPAGDVAPATPEPTEVPRPDADAVARAAELLADAERPVLVFGGGAIAAGDTVRKLAERLGAPTGLTINAKGLLAPDHPLLAGSHVAFAPWRVLMADADVVLAAGTEIGETDFDFFRDGGAKVSGKLIRVDIDPDQIDKNLKADLGIVADAASTLDALLEALGEGAPRRADGAERAAAVQRDTLESHGKWMKTHIPYYEAITEAFADPIIVGDSTAPVYSANCFFNAPVARSYFTSSTGFGTLGYGLPAAVGAKVANPDRPVVCVIGDGGLLFTVAELVSGVEAKAGFAILLWNNERYLTIKDYMIQDQIRPVGVIEHSPDFQALARACGCETVRLTGPEGLADALKAAHGREVPTLVEVFVPEEG